MIEILLAEDSPDDVVLIKEAFVAAEIMNGVHVVGDGVDAMAFLRREGRFRAAPQVGLTLLDINMPLKNGFDVLKEIKADPALKSMPVVMLTSSSREEDIVRSYTNGACSFVTKPVGHKSLTEVVRNFSIYWALVASIPAQGGKGIAV